jgi:hypothetical protein
MLAVSAVGIDWKNPDSGLGIVNGNKGTAFDEVTMRG